MKWNVWLDSFWLRWFWIISKGSYRCYIDTPQLGVRWRTCLHIMKETEFIGVLTMSKNLLFIPYYVRLRTKGKKLIEQPLFHFANHPVTRSGWVCLINDNVPIMYCIPILLHYFQRDHLCVHCNQQLLLEIQCKENVVTTTSRLHKQILLVIW